MRSPKQRMAATLAMARQLVLTPTEDRRPQAAMELAMEAAQLLEVAEGVSGRWECVYILPTAHNTGLLW